MIKKSKKVLNGKNVKITKQEQWGYASSYNVEILNSFNPEPQLKNTEFAFINRLKQLLIELRGFKFVATLVLVFKKIKSDDKTKYDTFNSN